MATSSALPTETALAVPSGAILTTARCFLRPYLATDVSASNTEMKNDPILASTLRDRFPSPYTQSDEESWVAQCLAHSPTRQFCICLLPSIDHPAGKVIGSIGLEEPGADIERRGRELGYLLFRPYWGKGYMSEVVSPFVRWAFSPVAGFGDLLRIEAHTFSTHLASQRILLKAGFTKEGVRRSAIVKKKGVVMDLVVFGLVKGDLEEEEEKRKRLSG